MGDPKFQKKKYVTPGHPWQKERLEAESKLKAEYGIKNKKELWKMVTFKRRISDQVKGMIADQGVQAQIERKALLDKLFNLGLLTTATDIDHVLSIEIKDIMERRLQTLVFRKNLAKSMVQARQFIVHGHILVGGKKITSPSHLATRAEEQGIRFSLTSAFSEKDHPEIVKEEKLGVKK